MMSPGEYVLNVSPMSANNSETGAKASFCDMDRSFRGTGIRSISDLAKRPKNKSQTLIRMCTYGRLIHFSDIVNLHPDLPHSDVLQQWD